MKVPRCPDAQMSRCLDVQIRHKDETILLVMELHSNRFEPTAWGTWGPSTAQQVQRESRWVCYQSQLPKLVDSPMIPYAKRACKDTQQRCKRRRKLQSLAPPIALHPDQPLNLNGNELVRRQISYN